MSKKNDELATSMVVSVEGPYGRTESFAKHHRSLLFVAGGIGFTPFNSILREMHNQLHSEVANSKIKTFV